LTPDIIEQIEKFNVSEACFLPPPRSINLILQLTWLDIGVFAALTAMTVLSVVIYLENTYYLLKKVRCPFKMKTLVWISAAPTVFCSLFLSAASGDCGRLRGTGSPAGTLRDGHHRGQYGAVLLLLSLSPSHENDQTEVQDFRVGIIPSRISPTCHLFPGNRFMDKRTLRPGR
ncbi:hypothetical protein scyTo_0020713, partial [Scyliorhinus torazame]|nr:hypothetical protein [Scyliorhinus torazame]